MRGGPVGDPERTLGPTSSMRCTFLAFLGALGGCVLDQDLIKSDDTAGVPDSPADSPDSVETAGEDTDTDPTDTGPADTGPVETGPQETADTSPSACPDLAFPAVDVPVVDVCVPAVTPAWELEELWSTDVPGYYYGTPVVGPIRDTNGDGWITAADDLAIVVVGGGANEQNHVRAYDAGTGELIWVTPLMDLWEGSSAVLLDVDLDGTMEIVYFSYYGNRALNGEDGSTQWINYTNFYGENIRGAPSATDIEGDGQPEVIYGPFVVDGGTGAPTLIADSPTFGSGIVTGLAMHTSIAADIDLDGKQELVLGPNVMDDDGWMLWDDAGADGYPAVGQLDADLEPEIVVSRAGEVCLHDNDGTELWCATMERAALGASPPVVADLDGDGVMEIVSGGWGWIGAFAGDGTPLWAYDAEPRGPLADTLFDGIIAYDLDADGAAEIVAATTDGLVILDGGSGAELAAFETGEAWVEGQSPTIADVDGDGDAEVVFGWWDTLNFDLTLYVLGDRDGFARGPRSWGQAAYTESAIDVAGAVPDPIPPSWISDPGFRAGGDGGRQGDIAPVLLDLCLEDCGEDTLVVWYSIANHDSVDRTAPVTVEFLARTDAGWRSVRTETWSDTLLAHTQAEGRRVEIHGLPEGTNQLAVRLLDALDCDAPDDITSSGPLTCN